MMYFDAWPGIILAVALAIAASPVPPDAGAGVSPALRSIFAAADRVVTEVHVLSPAAVASLRDRFGRSAISETVALGRVEAKGATIGRFLVLDGRGYDGPVRVGVGLGPNGAVAGVVILSHQESRARSMASPDFLRQFLGKRPNDPIRVNRDIDRITGATVSARAVADAVRRVVAIGAALGPAERR